MNVVTQLLSMACITVMDAVSRGCVQTMHCFSNDLG